LNIWLLPVAVPVHNLVLEVTPVAVAVLAVC
jgi:hypothetical protein